MKKSLPVMFCARRRCRKQLTRDQVRRGGLYCGKSCAALEWSAKPRAVRREWIERANTRRRVGYYKRVVRRVLEALRSRVDAEGRVPLREAVRVTLQFRREGYARGWGARDQRRRRGEAMNTGIVDDYTGIVVSSRLEANRT